jgi:hypothetical protein
MDMGEAMIKIEFERVQRFLEKQEKVAIETVKARSMEVMADFENQMGQRYSYDDDPVFAQLRQQAEQYEAKIQKGVAARCRELGIAKQFMPHYSGYWSERGENALSDRRIEAQIHRHPGRTGHWGADDGSRP